MFLDSQIFRADERNASEFEFVLKIDIARNDNHRGMGVQTHHLDDGGQDPARLRELDIAVL